MRSVIDFSLFLFNCINVIDNNKNLKFTYKTNKEGFSKLTKNFITRLTQICNDDKFYTSLSKRKHDHPIDDVKTKERIAYIFENQKYPKQWINEYIWQSIIYQTEYHSTKQRLFYITEQSSNRDFFLIRPLFLDLNHAISPNNTRDNVRYENCYVCHNDECSLE